MIGWNHGKYPGALSGLLFVTLRSGTISRHAVYLFSMKILTSCYKDAQFSSPISSTIFNCAGFSKKTIPATSFVIASVLEMKGIWIDGGKIQPCILTTRTSFLGFIPCIFDSHSLTVQCKNRILHKIPMLRALLASHGKSLCTAVVSSVFY